MIASVDPYLSRVWNDKTYNCLHFACDVWRDMTGVDITEQLLKFHAPVTERKARRDVRRQFVEIDRPEDPCIVVFKGAAVVPHVGIYLRGRVLHIYQGGVEFQPVEVVMRWFKSVRFYQCKL